MKNILSSGECEIPNRLVIKNSGFGVMDLFYIVLFLFLIYVVFLNENMTVSLILFVVICGCIVYLIIRRLKDKTEKIIIDKKGITLNCDSHKVFIQWDDVKYAYLKQTAVGVGKSTRVVERFHIETMNDEFIVKMNEFSYDPSLLNT